MEPISMRAEHSLANVSSWKRIASSQAAALVPAAVLLVVFVVAAASPATALTIDTVPIGSPGNPADGTGYGAVGYNFRMGRTEVTNAQYVEFLNAVAASDPYELFSDSPLYDTEYNGIVRSGSSGSYTYDVKPPAVGQGPGGTDYTYDDKPVTYVTLFGAIRFANWLHNGQGSGDTESGAYSLAGGTPVPSNGNTVTRNPGARWVVPTENEWYKAAYYDPSSGLYADYATGDNTTPNDNPPSADNGNSVNYNLATANPPYLFTDVGAYALSGSHFGTFDQNGNVMERMESFFLGNSGARVSRGSSAFDVGGVFLPKTWRNGEISGARFSGAGFRVASVPEPSAGSLALVLMVMAYVFYPRRYT